MMKWSFAIHALVGSVLVVPAVTLQSGRSRSLEASLDDTVRALEVLSGIDKRVQTGERAAVQLARAATEAPSGNPRADDERLAQLRGEVGQLQMRLDDLDGVPAPMPDIVKPGAPTTGLAPRQLDVLAARAQAELQTPEPVAAPVHADPAVGFSADPVRQGRACYRAGRYDDCVRVLSAHLDDASAMYWTARAQERLGKDADALALYESITQRRDAGWLASRARDDAEFLRWKANRVGGVSTAPATNAPAATTNKEPH